MAPKKLRGDPQIGQFAKRATFTHAVAISVEAWKYADIPDEILRTYDKTLAPTCPPAHLPASPQVRKSASPAADPGMKTQVPVARDDVIAGAYSAVSTLRLHAHRSASSITTTVDAETQPNQ